jgi:phenylpropionate dioxygenase-like ring-hydroxylating dioxygenase large terminal subunit
MNKPVFLSYQELLDQEDVSVPEALRLDTKPNIANDVIATDVWTDRTVFEREVERLWPKVWQMVCREAALQKAGDYCVYDVARYSILLVRTESGDLKGFHNSCLHRGRALKSGRGTSRELRCPYHGFCWHLDGSFKEAYCDWEFDAEQLSELKLPEVQVTTWGGWVLINMDLEAPSFEEYAPILAEHFERWKPEDRYVSLHVEKKIRCNWKIAMEAFIESYHAIQTHPQILSFTGGDNSQYDVFGDHLSRTITAQGIPNPGQADRYSVQESVEAMTGPGGFEQAQALTGLSADEMTSRQAIGAVRRAQFADFMDADALSSVTDAETMDSILYLVFPNFAPWGGFQSQITYRYRPDGMNPDGCIMDIYLLDGFPQAQPRPADAQTIRLDYDQKYAEAEALGLLGALFDQDANNLPEVQKGLMASKTQKALTADYQELRIRHFHQTLSRYLNEMA